mgnify:CR=1 FL=1
MEFAIVIAVVVVALVFDYTNGFHDAANAIATSISTRALTPRVALAMAAVMNFVGAFLGTEVAQTVGQGVIVAPEQARRRGLTSTVCFPVGNLAPEGAKSLGMIGAGHQSAFQMKAAVRAHPFERVLGWKPRTTFEELIRLMTRSDLEMLARTSGQVRAWSAAMAQAAEAGKLAWLNTSFTFSAPFDGKPRKV